MPIHKLSIGTSFAPMIRALAISLCLAGPAAAQAPSAILTDLWNNFSNTCAPFLANPVAAMAQSPANLQYLRQEQSADGRLFRRHQGRWGLGQYRLVEVAVGTQAAHVYCQIGRTSPDHNFNSNAMEATLRQILPADGSMRLAGGPTRITLMDPNDDTEGDVDGISQTYRKFLLEGALGPRSDLILIEMSSPQVLFTVSATVPLEDVQ